MSLIQKLPITRFFNILIIISLFLLTSGCRQPDAYDMFDQPVFLDNFKGKWILLNYWATWCKACQEEIPTLNRFSQTYAKQVVVLGINYDHLPKATLQEFVQAHQIQYPILMTDIRTVFGIQSINALPATFIISPEGKVVKELYGEQSPEALLAAMKTG